MKNGTLTKNSIPTEDEIKEINKYTRRNLTANEVYTFSVSLCDNKVDKDFECFTVDTLEKLSKLYLGKTGILDHNMSNNPTARIYECHVETVEPFEMTENGEAYSKLIAKAYIVKNEKSEKLISQLETGIKKEVSIGCSISKLTCNICKADLKYNKCEHVKGRIYNNQTCYIILDEPTDAYEWSFVAEPATKQEETSVPKIIPTPLTFQYTNWQGHFNTRSVDGNTARIYYGHDEWHKEDQWLMEALDLDKGELRHFAMKDIMNIC